MVRVVLCVVLCMVRVVLCLVLCDVSFFSTASVQCTMLNLALTTNSLCKSVW